MNSRTPKKGAFDLCISNRTNARKLLNNPNVSHAVLILFSKTAYKRETGGVSCYSGNNLPTFRGTLLRQRGGLSCIARQNEVYYICRAIDSKLPNSSVIECPSCTARPRKCLNERGGRSVSVVEWVATVLQQLTLETAKVKHPNL